jgi:hypothetical protein
MAVQAVPSSVTQRIIIKFLKKEGAISSEILPGFKHSLGMNVCRSQGCSDGRNHFEKNETMLKMKVTLGDQELLSIQATF